MTREEREENERRKGEIGRGKMWDEESGGREGKNRGRRKRMGVGDGGKRLKWRRGRRTWTKMRAALTGNLKNLGKFWKNIRTDIFRGHQQMLN